MSVSPASLSTTAATASAGSDGLYSLSAVVPASVLDVPPVTQAGKDPLVAAVLEDITVYNKLAWMQQNTDWTGYESQFGAAMTAKAKAEQIAGLARFANLISFESSASGVPVAAGSATKSGLTVARTPIPGSTAPITVRTEQDGSLSAFRNGQFWKTFTGRSLVGLDPKLGAGDIALQLLDTKQDRTVRFA
ncbi:hypothetical protein [Lichenicola sp.]|uniref:hypothetical protein n=1 Tax=Lichenicola sp. TaxID=2804529 RepID=UPI003AFF779B